MLRQLKTAWALVTVTWSLFVVTLLFHNPNFSVVLFNSCCFRRLQLQQAAQSSNDSIVNKKHEEKGDDSLSETTFQRRRNETAMACRQYFGFDATTYKEPELSGLFREVPPWSRTFLEYTFFDDRYKLLFCTIPKVASTNVKEMLLDFLDRHLVTFSPYAKIVPHIHRLLELPASMIKQRMNYTKIIVVRHPLDRLISTWRDKFSKGVPYENAYLRPHAIKMLQQYRKPLEQSLSYYGSEPVKLHEFFEYLRNEETTKNSTDAHWRPYVDHCDPCRISYDYIARFENLVEELAYIVNVTTGRGIKTALPTPRPGSFASDMSKKRLIDEEIKMNINANQANNLRSIYGDLLPQQLIQDVAQIYRKDFDIFGYKFYF